MKEKPNYKNYEVDEDRSHYHGKSHRHESHEHHHHSHSDRNESHYSKSARSQPYPTEKPKKQDNISSNTASSSSITENTNNPSNPSIPKIDITSYKASFLQNPQNFLPVPLRNDKTAKKKKNAYIFLVLKGEKYIKGALIGAFSLKLTKSTQNSDVICMITDDVKNTPGFNSLLSTHYLEQEETRPLFDEVYEIPYITHTTKPLVGENQKEMYGSWMDVSFTKWNCLQLDEYEKILFLDSDICVVKNIENLFSDFEAPAATFSRRNAQPFLDSGMENPYLVKKYFNDVDDDYILEQPKHGEIVPKETIRYAIDNGFFVGVGTTVLLKPSKAKFIKYLETIFQEPIFNDSKPRSMSGADEVSICQFFAFHDTPDGEEWKYISQIYNYIWNGSSGNDWLKGTGFTHTDIRIRHLFGLKKPWQMWTEKEKKWEDVKSWWEAQAILFSQDIPQNKEMKEWWVKEEEQAKSEAHNIPTSSSSHKRRSNDELKAQASYSRRNVW